MADNTPDTVEAPEENQEIQETAEIAKPDLLEVNQKDSNPTNNQADAEPEMEFMKNAPAEVRQMFGAFMRTGSKQSYPPYWDHVNGEHIHKFLDNQIEVEKIESDQQDKTRKSKFWIYIITLIFFVFLILFLAKDNSDLLVDIFIGIAILAGGLGAGYGLNQYSK